ncbi:MAG: S8 family serine peptidase [Armatimonadota bacterium]
MKSRILVSVVALAALIWLAGSASVAFATRVTRSPGGHAIAYIHDFVQQQAEESGQARVIVVLGSPSLPQARARDWRERGAAIDQLVRRAQSDAPHFRVREGYQIFPFVAGTADRRGLDELAASSVVEAVYPDREHHAVLSESGPLIGRPEAETAGYTGEGIGIAVIDTGVDYSHPDLGGGGFPNAKVVGGHDFVNSDSNPMDDNGHGTYTSGIAAGAGAVYRGIAPGAHIIALKVLDSTGLGYSSAIISALQWCVTHQSEFNIRVANLSLSDSAEWRDQAQCDGDPEGQAITAAADAGIVVAVAAGNEGYFNGIGMPACATKALAVGASWDSGAEVDSPASFSNRGELLDVYAPGIWITAPRWSGDPEGSGRYLTGAGTSSAAPHVAGAAADVFEMLGPSATVVDVSARLMRTGIQIVDPTTGVGTPRIDLVRAMANEPTSGPDLIVTAVSSTSSSGLQGAAMSVSLTVKNQGDETSGACEAAVGLSENAVASPQDPSVASVGVPSLAPGASWSSGSIDGVVPAVPPHSYSITAFVDSRYQVAEKDEGNNGRLGSAFAVKLLSSYIQSSTIPLSMSKGQSASVSVTIWNDGTTAWTSADGYALSSASPLGNTTWGVSKVALPTATVAAGATVTFTFTITAPAEAGLYPCYWQMVKGNQPFGEVASAASKTRVIDDTLWGQAYSTVSGDWVGYEDYRPRPGSNLLDSAVSMTNLATGRTVSIPFDVPFPRDSSYPYAPFAPYENFDISYHMFPDVSGSWATWVVDDYPANVWSYQIAAQNAQDLATLPLRVTYQNADAMFPAIDGHIVVWEDYRNDPDGMRGVDLLSDNSDIYICDLNDVSGPDDHFPEVHPLCTAPGPQFAPRISGNWVVWEDWRDTANAQSDIYAYDLAVDSDSDGVPNWKEATKPDPDPAEIRLTDTFYSEEYPDISGRTVVWMDLRRDTGTGSTIDLYAFDLDTTTTVAIATDPPTFRYHPRIDYPLVVWEDYSNDADGPTASASLVDQLSDNPDIYLHHMQKGFSLPIAGSSGVEEWPDISGDRVTYSRLRGVVPHTDGQGTPYQWPVFNTWVQSLPPEGMTGIASFSDVPANFWAWKQIEAAITHGVVTGYPGGVYEPTWTVTRDQMAVYIARALAGGDANVPDGPATPRFSDVDPLYWAYKYIEYCADPTRDVVKGYEDGTYQPLLAVNRGQMAAYVGRALAGGDSFFATYTPPGGPTFPDVASDFWAYKYVEYIADAGVTRGYPDGSYHPEIGVSRDQMAVYIANAFGYD